MKREKRAYEEKLISVTEDYTGKNILSFHFNGKKYEVYSWRGLLLELSSILYDMHKDDFGKVLELGKPSSSYFTNDASHLNTPKEIPKTGIFVETNLSANGLARVCRYLLDALGYRVESLAIEIEDREDKPQYEIDRHFQGSYVNMKPVFDELASEIRKLGSDITIRVSLHYIAFVRRYSFAILYVRSHKINIELTIDSSIQSTRLGRARHPSWGKRSSKATSISKIEDIDTKLMEFIKHSYDRS
ncbi:DUF5655 domain-containing protein [Candidatus Poribacteria bacterium]